MTTCFPMATTLRHTRRLVNKARTLAEQGNRDLPPAR